MEMSHLSVLGFSGPLSFGVSSVQPFGGRDCYLGSVDETQMWI